MLVSRRSLRYGFALFLVPVLAIGAALHIGSETVKEGLRLNAETSAKAWARYLSRNVPDLAEIARGAAPSAASLEAIAMAKSAGSVFRFRVYAPDGTLEFILDEQGPGQDTPASLRAHNPAAAGIALRGELAVQVEEGTAPDEPAYFAEVYLPIMKDGSLVAVVEAYVDQTAQYEGIAATVRRSAILLSLIIALASAIPAIAFMRRHNAKLRADERLAFLSDHDGMTELLNRSGFVARSRRLFEDSGSLAVISVGLDGFGAINAGLGPEVGDRLLLETSERLKGIAPASSLMARVGSAEFAFAFEASDTKEAARFAARCLQQVRRPLWVKGKAVHLTASAGLTIGDREEDAGSPLARASIAMRRSREKGGDGLTIFDRRMNAEIKAGRDLEALLRQTVDDEAFDLHFQPIFRAGDLSLVGFEALIRMPNGEGGYVSPGDFIPLAERLGLIARIGRWSLRHACAVAATWPDELIVAVNLSPAQFELGNMTEIVRGALAETDLPARRLELEITEGVLAADALEVARQLGALRELGVRLALDDFGTGFSSLSYLWKFPVDKVKIDRSFVHGMQDPQDNAASIIRSIVALGRSLNLRVTAEGVETEAQMQFLTELGCDELQGFYLGRPASRDLAAARVLKLTNRRLAAGADRPAARAASSRA
ncbi:bifunctional diguanylate cyclase/phosphodiesterase [Afifella sp. IM 167]|uniref:putative bifunctional diguanylate cyclase/phosphodiesterase n=1 Tax=Afifella sp. IM 167 TaxID=2033586 RepID=UPI001CCFD340|nr:bifunctional diguanylate cyclase/phosphodiesterase [Afifella sp. IM 167]MBZ8133557.1 hypothetical protein [Afifella sp. IM 167]